MKTYEALLLVEPTIAAKEWTRVGEEVDRIVKRHGGSVIQLTRFGERKLAFPVKKNNRGTYVLFTGSLNVALPPLTSIHW